MRYLLLILALCGTAESFAQIDDSAIRRRGVATTWRHDEGGNVVDRVEDSFVNRDPGDFSFTALAEFEAVGCVAGQSVNWNANGDSLVATGSFWLELDKPAESVTRAVSASTDATWEFSTSAVSSLFYSGSVAGGAMHQLHLLPLEEGPSWVFDLSDQVGSFSVELPELPSGEWELMVAFFAMEESDDHLSYSASCNFNLLIRPESQVAVDSDCWGDIKALYR